MKEDEGNYRQEHLLEEIINTIERGIMEYNLTYCDIIGVLEVVKQNYFLDIEEQAREESEENDE